MPNRNAAQIETARALYADRTKTLQQIADEAGVSTSTLTRWARQEGWPRRGSKKHLLAPQPPSQLSAPDTRQEVTADDRKDLIDRLYRLVHHNVKILESRMSDENASDANGPERDMRVVGTLVRSVEKLKELEPEQSKRDNSAGNSRRDLITPEEEDLIRRRVVEHILKLRERKRREGGDC